MSGSRIGTAVHYSRVVEDYPESHMSATRAWIARRLAGLLTYEYGGEFDPARQYQGHLYSVPNGTLIGDGPLRELRIREERDFFGGAAPHAFLATKSIAHPLFDEANAPAGWSAKLARQGADALLPGYTAFNAGDADRAGRRLLGNGPIRLKPGEALGGQDQTVVADALELGACLKEMDPRSISTSGVVVEQNLEEITTYSVGLVRVGDLFAAYVGTQHMTPNNSGGHAYGGSELIFARGDYDALLSIPLSMEFRVAVQRASTFDHAVREAYPRLLASRRNYDVARGRDAGGNWHFGVLEQSWRIGGATPAEIAALEALQRDPTLRAVKACCVERYGSPGALEPEAIVSFSGVDDRIGHITKYSFVDTRYGNTS